MLIVVTRLRLCSVRLLPAFAFVVLAAYVAAALAPGNRGVRLRWSGGLRFWTLTAWRWPADMQMFRRSPAHQRAMRVFPLWCDEGSYAHWESEMFPSWEGAAKMLRMRGHLSPTLHPSAAQRAGIISVE